MRIKKILKVKKNLINEDIKLLNKIKKCKPSLIITYGCSILNNRVD